MWYFLKIFYCTILVLLFWTQLEKILERDDSNGSSEKTVFLLVYIYLNLLEYLLTVIYYSMITQQFDKYHRPTEQQL